MAQPAPTTPACNPRSPDAIIRVARFVKRYKKHIAVDRVDFTVKKGEIYGLIGPDGAGKSSLMKGVAGVLTYEEGCAEVFGTVVDSERAAEQVKQRIVANAKVQEGDEDWDSTSTRI